jgi:uncharacterized membrane protein YbhN (UPF0104 family)
MKRKFLIVAQWAYFPIVMFLGWRVFGESSAEILQIIDQIKPLTFLFTGVAVLVGLMVTGIIWAIVFGFQGYSRPTRHLQPAFYIGQLAKYIPGSVWVFGAQAHLIRKLQIPGRAAVTTGLVFLYVNVTSATVLGLAVIPILWPQFGLRGVPLVVIGITGLILLSPIPMKHLIRLLSSSETTVDVRLRKQIKVVAGIFIVWILYGFSIKILSDSISSGSNITLLYATCAYAIAYAFGVLAVFSPAGIGVREGVLIYALTPELGLETSLSIALITRLLHTSSDFLLATFWFLKSRDSQLNNQGTT